jgi:hypothetical protein
MPEEPLNQPTLTPAEFAAKWQGVTTTEKASAQSHFIDLCRMLGEPTPHDADPTGTQCAFERRVTKAGGGEGFADVWKRDFPRRGRLRLRGSGLAGVALEKVANDLADASTLPRGARDDAPVDVPWNSDRDPGSMCVVGSVERGTSAASPPRRQVQALLDSGRQLVDVALGQRPPTARLHSPWHRITSA